jgi:hypothetical protein
VFACGAYDLQPGSAPTAHLDLLYAELAQEHVSSMPQLAPDLVARDNLTARPGWAIGGRRFLLASCAPGKLDSIPWPPKSPTKRRVARQRQPDPAQRSLFDDISSVALGDAAVEAPRGQDDLDPALVPPVPDAARCPDRLTS